jgi:hypothetical protein
MADETQFNPFAQASGSTGAKAAPFNPFAGVEVVPEEEAFNPFMQPVTPGVAGEFDGAEQLLEVDAVSGATAGEPVQSEAPEAPASPLDAPVPAPKLLSLPAREAAAPAQAPFSPFAATAAPADTLVTDVRTSSRAYADLGKQKAALTSQLGNLSAQMSVEGDQEKLKGMETQRQELLRTLNLVSAAQGEAGARANAGLLEAQENATIAKADADLAAAEAITAGADAAREQAELKLANLKAQESDARAQANEDRAKYRALIARGPKAKVVGTTLADIISEAFSATINGRVADFSGAATRAWNRDRQAFAEERQSAKSLVELSGDTVRDLARQQDVVRAEEAAQKAALFESVTRRAQLDVQRAVTPLQKAQAAMVYKGMQEQAELAAAQAAQARLEALQKEQQRRLDAEYKRAQIMKLQSDARQVDAKTAKLQRRGGGVGNGSLLDPELKRFSKADRTRIRTLGVRHPLTGRWIADSRGVPLTAPSTTEAKELRESAVASKTVIDQLNTIKSIKKGYGGKSWASLGAAGQSKAKQALQSWGVQAKAALNKAFKFGAMDSGTMELFDTMLGDPAGLWDNLGKLDAVIEGTERSFNDKMVGLTGAQTLIQYPRIREAPKKTLSSAMKILNQAPDLKALDRGASANVSASRRIAALDDAYSTELERTGSPRKASEALSSTLRATEKRVQAGRSRLQEAFDEAKPENYGDLQTELLAATGAQVIVNPDDGEAMLRAEERVNAAKKAVRDATTPKMRALQRAMDEEWKFLRELSKRIGKEKGRQSEYKELQESRKEEQRRVAEEFEGGQMPSGARGF